MRPADIGDLVSASSPVVSPDGRRVAFVVRRVDLAGNAYRSQVWLADADGTSRPRPLTAGTRKDADPAWSPDGRSLAFTSSGERREHETTLHVLPIDGPGERRTLTTLPESIEGLRWSPDGRHLAFTSRTRDARYEHDDESRQPPRRITRFFSRLDDEGWTLDRPRHVYVVPADGTQPPRNLTPGEFEFDLPSWLADSSGVVCSGRAHPTWDRDLAEDLYLVDLASGERRALTDHSGVYGHPSCSPGGGRVAFLGFDDPTIEPQNAHVGVLELSSGERRWVSRDLDRTFLLTGDTTPPCWDGEDHVLALVEDRGRVRGVRVAADGAAPPEPFLDGDRVLAGLSHAAGTTAFVASHADRPAELVVRRGGGEQVVTDLTAPFVAKARPRRYEHFLAPSSHDVEVDAWIVTPHGFDPERRYPVLLQVHGGPHAQHGWGFFDEAQLYARGGYVVLLSNPRGSSGREEAWGQAILGPRHPKRPGTGWGAADVDDVLAVLDEALRRYPFCDPERVGMLGGSYGGYMATWLAAHHGSRFRAICSERSVNNLLSEEWTSDIATVFRTELGPTHLDAPEEYLRMSPISYVRQIDVPMLLVHSENDLRCAIEQAEQLFVALRLLDKEVELVRFPGEGHELSRSGSPVHRVQRAEIILEFFGRHLEPETAAEA